MSARMHPGSARAIATIRALRAIRKLSAQNLAAQITAAGYPISRTVLSNYENGRKDALPLDFVIVAAEVLGTTLSDLMDGVAKCPACSGTPPEGFTCNTCTASGSEVRP
ncbi:helix-turn-helix transcriptional regulator [Streptomyces sp. NPDC096153]|uniref:helix-turn-helix domain-containing protein n=1 Tax=Streptomyces sp. NPDC096153 TaxID=3155548 RepID=UPI00331B9A2B